MRNLVGEDDLRFVNAALPVGQLKDEILKEIRGWTPSNDHYRLNEYVVCQLEGDSKRFSSSVRWAVWSMDDVRSPSGRWREGGGDIFVAERSLMAGDMGLIFPCKIKDASSEQQEMIPLQVRVGQVGSPAFSDSFQEDLALALAKSMRDDLGCVNRPEIPDSLKDNGKGFP
ncbi:hypothetical protein Sipo8835_07565 [Streptomyces ipomoeae]|uniref:Uncharacterized protein n=1 Tax=Streptomyces ipomoeae TaxID=103232 RepID=A0AAE9B2H2_9ACTN|nr:hypothetical protein [Streptomyces ipomoeae]TQE37532.1 hypothetical protein Sipo8835_07565 [Streptomyces ipomoeae]